MSIKQKKYPVMIKVGPYETILVAIEAWSETEAIKKAEEKYPASYALRYSEK